MASRSFCFTLFDETVPPFPDYVRYAIYQREKCPESGRLHYQGYMEFNSPKKIGGLKKWSSTAHFESRRGSREEARAYCMKEESRVSPPVEFGKWTAGQGHRTDLDSACELIKKHGVKRVAEELPAVFVKFHKGLKELARTLESVPSDSDFIPRPWQKKILSLLPSIHNDRNILWISDTVGNQGKSRLALHLCLEHNAVILSGKIADMAYAYNKEPIVIFDVPRTQAENLDHLFAFAESLKNGIIFSNKYESQQKIFKPPIVIFFANIPCPEGKWSCDRVIERDLNCPNNHE